MMTKLQSGYDVLKVNDTRYANLLISVRYKYAVVLFIDDTIIISIRIACITDSVKIRVFLPAVRYCWAVVLKLKI